MKVKESGVYDEVEFKGVKFVGRQWGIGAGHWWVSKADAKKIAKACNVNLPRCGYDRALDDNKFKNYLTNISNKAYRVAIESTDYTHRSLGFLEKTV